MELNFVWVHLEYIVQFWSPYQKQDIELVYRVQPTATKMVQSLASLEYELARLSNLGKDILGGI